MSDTESNSDAALILLLAAGENLALDIIMKRYQEPVYYFALRYIHDEDLAYDIVQETFFRVYTRAATYKPEYRFTTWLYQIALNLCRDYGRKSALRQFFSLSDREEEGRALSAIAHDSRIEEQFDIEHDIHELHKQIAKLPHKLKTALILYSLEENSQAICSEILGISKKSVETRVYRARKILEEKMSAIFEG